VRRDQAPSCFFGWEKWGILLIPKSGSEDPRPGELLDEKSTPGAAWTNQAHVRGAQKDRKGAKEERERAGAPGPSISFVRCGRDAKRGKGGSRRKEVGLGGKALALCSCSSNGEGAH